MTGFDTDQVHDAVVSSAPGLVVRVAEATEWATVGDVTYRGFTHGSPGRAEPTEARLRLLRDAEGRAASGDLLVAVDETEGTIIGTASLLRADTDLTRQSQNGEAELRLLAVVPEARRRGVARALMLEAIRRARAWGAPALVLDTGPANTASQALYASLGFDRVTERETQPSSSGGLLAVFRYALTGSDDERGVK
ncbi:hypothetical protein GCM10025867_35460 [Frondihabitans sucicola]|uniref:N-acetyltransferase domain-containing protein n=1 Tax=Frondihabitans sucicola TaxID=1268041 RepID=A0ABM8GS58_9MICO|nr:GNAT family N-acetyltransferase [Frondihabitans sucicola]BDZ51305.1 hypothetical protein GCM10025867_35460 [Frondihabitans sucicola]